MYPTSPLLMIAFVAVTYLATYGGGAALSQMAGLRLRSGAERFGVACAVGSVLLSWVGYVAVVAALPWLPAVACWLSVALAAVVIIRSRKHASETQRLPRRDLLILVGAMAIGLLFAGGMQWGQVRYLSDGGMMGRLIWPDTLYRNAVMARLLECSGAPDWPWLAGVPMTGMSLLRFTAMIPSLKALHLPSTCYQTASLWIGLYGIPVAAFALFAFFRALGAAVRTCSLAVLLTSFLGNPRWLLNDRFAHSPALHWAGGDVFAIAVPVLFSMLALIVLAVRERQRGALWLAAFMVISGMGHAPWMGLPLYPGLALWLVVSLVRKEQVRSAAVLAVSATLGYVVLKVLMGSGTGGGAPLLEGVGPSPTIRALTWAFPFLDEPLRPLLSSLGPTNLMKLVKFASVYLVACWFYLVGSLWVRMVLMPNVFRFRREWLRSAEGSLLCCVTVAAVLLTSVVNFNKIAFQGAQYDALRLLWIPLLLANLGVAAVAVVHGGWLRRGWGVLVVLLFVYYGSWENTQLALWSRTSLPYSVIRSSDMAALRYLDQHVALGDVVAINPRAQVPGEGVATGNGSAQITHRWGYVSGLLGSRLYLDNEDMARKFGQGPLWDARLLDFQQGMKSASALTNFARSHQIRWIMLQGNDKLPTGSNSREVFRDRDVRVYTISS